ncbi:hypothetical protein pD_gene0078 [Vibrio phage 033B]|nr:hypothetical protein pD_gene0078 [Vibrio phage 033B]
MAANFYRIEQILVKAYRAIGLDLPTGYPNRDLKEKPDGLWVSLDNIRGISTVATLGSEGRDHNPGIFQINVNYPLNKGTKHVNQTCDEIASAFPAGTSFTDQGVFVKVSGCTVDEGREVEGYWRGSVSVSYYSRNARR